MGDAGTSYLGSHMSLVTTQNVRYQGILAEVDMVNSRLRLTNVHCLGTEDRAGLGTPQVPPSDQIYETVVFQANEVKELTMMSAPPPAPYPVVAPPPSTPWGAPPAPTPAMAMEKTNFGANPWGAPPTTAAAPPPPPPAAKSAPVPAPTVAVSSVPKVLNGDAPRPRPVSYAHAAGGNAHANATGGRGGGRGGTAGGRHGGGGRGGHHYNGHPPPHHHAHHHHPAQPLTIPTEEFNFEEALKKFNKEEIIKEEPVDVVKVTYKKDDFFDEISCEALERLNVNGESGPQGGNRVLAAARRKTDMETFGRTTSGGRGGRGGRTSGQRGGGGGQGRGRGGRSQSGPAAA